MVLLSHSMLSRPLRACISFTVAALATAWLYSIPCEEKAECMAIKQRSASRDHHAYIALGLGVLFLREAVGLSSTIRELCDTKDMWGTRRSCPPVVLLCIVLGVLTVVELIFWKVDMPWSHAMLSMGDMTEAWRPIHSFRYFEWVINVPCLIILAGNCALARPMVEVVPPIVITNCYVLWAWAAMIAPNPATRLILVLMTFVGYGWASWIMCVQWVRDFLMERPFDGRSQYLRILVPVGLTLLFALYAINYLAGLSGLINAELELKLYTYAGFFAKVGFSAAFAYFRWVEDRQNLAILMGKVGTMNSTLMAILKSSFDVLVAATVAEDGTCTLAGAKTVDALELERMLQRPVAGQGLDLLVSGDEAKQQFALYAKNVVQQAEVAEPMKQPLANAVLDPSCKAPTPVAQVLHCAMKCGEDAENTKVRAKVHISPVPKSLPSASTGREVIVAIAFDTVEQDIGELPVDEAAMNMDEAATLSSEMPVDVFPSKKLHEKLSGKEGKKLGEQEGETDGKPRRRRAVLNKHLPAPDNSSETTGTDSAGVTGSGPNFANDNDSVYSTETVSTQVLGGSDAGSQPSKQSYPGSVHMATRQLLGPLLDSKAPAELVSHRLEDHMNVAAQMVRMQAPAAISHYRYKQEMAEWKERKKNQALVNVLEKQQAGGGVNDTVWFSEILPRVRGPQPGKKPRAPELPANPTEIWQKAYDITFEEDEDEESEDEE